MDDSFIVTRAQWGAQYGRGNDVSSKLPWGEVVVHTEAGAIRDQDWPEVAAWAALNISLTEKQKLRAIENFHVNTRGWNGIAYSFLFFPDGTVAEGRGWGRSGGHTEGRNSTAAGFCLIGHGDKQPATGAQWEAMRRTIAVGVAKGYLKPNPKISGHKDYSTKGKTCPGTLIYPHIQQELGGITGPTDPEGAFMALTDDEQKRLLANTDALSLLVQALEQRLVRVEAALNIADKGVKGHDGKEPFPVRTINSLTRIEAHLKTSP